MKNLIINLRQLKNRNTYNGQGNPNDFMGPALWPHRSVTLLENQESGGLLGSHIDMSMKVLKVWE